MLRVYHNQCDLFSFSLQCVVVFQWQIQVFQKGESGLGDLEAKPHWGPGLESLLDVQEAKPPESGVSKMLNSCAYLITTAASNFAII